MLCFASSSLIRLLNNDECKLHTRFTPESGHVQCNLGCPLCATSCHSHPSKQRPYSITSSATESKPDGSVSPSAFAVLTLITNSNLIDCITGSSDGFSPFRIRPV